ncbi:MAG: thioredoxin family protein, partial [Planctomycetota bacterium]
TAIGVGMALPYLLIGAFPWLVKFLPKPGAWMESFKQLMGFVLLGTVVFLISLLPLDYVVPTLAMLTATGLACWVYAGTPLTASAADRWQSYALCGAILLGGGVLSFGWLREDVVKPRIEGLFAANAAAGTPDTSTAMLADWKPDAWGPFSLAALGELSVERGETVLVDFGAEWCLTCKTLEQTVLHTDEVDRAIERAGVATMYADYTDYPAEVRETLAALRSQSVPVVAIFPGDTPYRPIVFRGGYTQSQLIEAIATAAGEPVEKIAAAP